MRCSTRRKRVHLISGFGGMFREQIRSVKKGDVVIAISFEPYGRETQYCLRIAHHHQALRRSSLPTAGLSPLSRYASAQIVRERRQRVRVSRADEHDLLVPGAVG